MNVSASVLPSEPFIPESGHYFYKLGVNPFNNDIFVTDAVDYQQNGYLLYYDQTGALVKDMLAEIIPGSFCFKQADK